MGEKSLSLLRGIAAASDTSSIGLHRWWKLPSVVAVIGFALVAIVGVLPIGLNVQKDNREETVINFDANYLIDAIRSGVAGSSTIT